MTGPRQIPTEIDTMKYQTTAHRAVFLLALCGAALVSTAASAAPRTPDPEIDALRAELREIKKAQRAELRRQATLQKLREQIAQARDKEVRK